MSNIKLEVGKTYRSRDGEEVRIIEKIGKGYWRCGGNNSKWYTESGGWDVCGAEHPEDLIEEVAEAPSETTRHTFAIPDGVRRVTVEQVGNRIVVEMVPEKEPKAGDVMINTYGSVYIFKEVTNDDTHMSFACLGKSGRLYIGWEGYTGRPATPEEAQPLFDALKKAGKRWNPETMQVEDVPEIESILEWVEANIEYGYYCLEDIAEVIEAYLNYKEGGK